MDVLSEPQPAHRIHVSDQNVGGIGELTAETVVDALAVLIIDLASALPNVERRETLERLANRLDDRGRTPNGTEAAHLLGRVGTALLRMGC